MRDKWSPQSARLPEIAEASYFCAHFSKHAKIRTAAGDLDKIIFGDSFQNTFDVNVPRTTAEAVRLEELIERLSSNPAEIHAVSGNHLESEVTESATREQSPPQFHTSLVPDSEYHQPEQPISSEPSVVATNLTHESNAPLSRPRYIPEDVARTEDPASAVWLNPHNHHSLPLKGRKAETELLNEFVNADEQFLITAVIAPSGAGKTRLVSQWSRPYIEGDKSQDWDAGFVTIPDEDQWNEENWTPTRNTLIIIDYTYTFGVVIGAIMQRFEKGVPGNLKIRLLVLDHVLPEKLHLDLAWKDGVSSLGFKEATSDLFFHKFPIVLEPATDKMIVLKEIIAAAADPYRPRDREPRYNQDSPEVLSAWDALMQIGAVDEATATRDEIRRRDAVRHPLFAALMGQMVYQDKNAAFEGMSRRDLIGHYFSNSRRLPWLKDAEDSEAGFWVGLYVSAGTLLRGISLPDIFEFHGNLPASAPNAPSSNDFRDIQAIRARFVSSTNRHTFNPLEPDILGETFVLKFLEDDSQGKRSRALAALIAICCENGLTLNAVEIFLETIQRLVRNLINDDQTLDDVEDSWFGLLSVLNPRLFPANSEIRIAISLALGNLLTQQHRADLKAFATAFALQVDFYDLSSASHGDRWENAAIAALHSLDRLIASAATKAHVKGAAESIFTNFQLNSRQNWSKLMMAASEGCIHVAKYVTANGEFDLNKKDKSGRTAIYLAAQNGHAGMIEWLAGRGADPNIATNEKKWSALMAASQSGHKEAVSALVAAGSNIDHTDYLMQDTALSLACVGQWSGTAKLLIESGASVRTWIRSNRTLAELNLSSENYCEYETRISYHCPVVEDAIENGAFPTFKVLVDHIVKTKGGQALELECALILSASFGLREFVEYLLEKGVPGGGEHYQESTPLIVCAENGETEIAKVLIEQGVKVDEYAQIYTALSHAIEGEFMDTVEALLDGGADPRKVSQEGKTVLRLACELGNLRILRKVLKDKRATENKAQVASAFRAASIFGHAEVIDALVDHGVSIDAWLGARRSTAVYFAGHVGNLETTRQIIELGANLNVRTLGQGWTPLMEASLQGETAIVSELIEGGAYVNQCTLVGGCTPLMIAAHYGYVETVETLVNGGASVNKASADLGWSAFTLAILRGRTEVVKRLVSHGALVDSYSPATKVTPLMIAAFNGGYEITQILVQAGAKLKQRDRHGFSALAFAATGMTPNFGNYLSKLIRKKTDQDFINSHSALSLDYFYNVSNQLPKDLEHDLSFNYNL
ncbi:MAG: ankyrin repeat domain-containing protein [Pseudomonadota bacterium]